MSIMAWAVLAVLVPGADERKSPNLLDSMESWERQGGQQASFQIADGHLFVRRAGREPAALLTHRNFENFKLDFEYKIDEWGESGLFLHAPRNGAFRAGLEIELANHYGGSPTPYSAGAVFRRQAPKTIPVKPSGQWNRVQVLMDFPKLAVHINGQLVQDLDLSAHETLRYSLRRGAIGFQNLGWGMEVRNLTLQPLPPKEHAIALFNGKDLTGWEVEIGKAKWEVRDGAIVGSDGDGYLRHEMQFEDFDLRMYIRTSPAANGGVYFRWLAYEPFGDRGHEIQILDLPGAVTATGSIYGIARGNDLLITPGQWELLQISVRGKQAVTHLNGVKCAESDSLKHVRPGHITLQMHRGKESIAFKELLLTPAEP